MLYVTTRNDRETYPSAKAIMENRGPDGGLYIPFRVQSMEPSELRSISELSFHECTAKILNFFFQTNLTKWDLEFGIGRYSVRLESMSHRIIIAETWHNPNWSFSALVRDVQKLIVKDKNVDSHVTPWMETGVRIAILFGVFSELIRAGIVSERNKMDISVIGADFSAPVSAWIARVMGLPIGNIIVSCNENSGVWNLFHHGELRTDAVSIPTKTHEADIAIPSGLEALINLCCGVSEANSFVDICRKGRMYCPDEHILAKLRQDIEVSVISEDRMLKAIPSVLGTSGYLLSPYSALTYSGLLDYRARTGESGYALVLSEHAPALDTVTVMDALKISEDALRLLINKQ